MQIVKKNVVCAQVSGSCLCALPVAVLAFFVRPSLHMTGARCDLPDWRSHVVVPVGCTCTMPVQFLPRRLILSPSSQGDAKTNGCNFCFAAQALLSLSIRIFV